MSLRLWMLIFGSAACAQFVTPPNNLIETLGHAGVAVRYKQVPTGICELDPAVKSYSGYADVGEEEHIFWWFFESRDVKPEDAPVTVWINGGPGSSSMAGLFAELGPCRVDYFGNVYNNPYSWTNVSNLLFVDQPSEVGFSYSQPVPTYEKNGSLNVLAPGQPCPDQFASTKCGTYSNPKSSVVPNSTTSAAPAFWRTLQGFIGAFPQYSKNDFHIATESYGGHYGPVFAAYIERQNDLNLPNAVAIQLGSLLIGNGWFDPEIQFQAFHNFTVSPGNTYDHSPFNQSMESLLYNSLYDPGQCLDQLKACKRGGSESICAAADSFCIKHVQDVYDEVSGRDVYDIRQLNPDPFPYSFFVDYLNKADVQKAIGAYTNFSSFSNLVYRAFGATGDDAREVNTIENLRYLLEHNITIALYAGDADYECNWIGVEAVAEAVLAPGFEQAGYTNLQTDDGIAHGQVRRAGKFSFTRVYQSGHMVPFYQPLASLQIFERVINGLDVESGLQPIEVVFATNGTKRSSYREGNETMQLRAYSTEAKYNTTSNRPGGNWRRPIIADTDKDYFSNFPPLQKSMGEHKSFGELLLDYVLYLVAS